MTTKAAAAGRAGLSVVLAAWAWPLLVVIAAVQLMVVLDATIVNVLPRAFSGRWYPVSKRGISGLAGIGLVVPVHRSATQG